VNARPLRAPVLLAALAASAGSAAAGGYRVEAIAAGTEPLPATSEVLWDGGAGGPHRGEERAVDLPFAAEVLGVRGRRLVVGTGGAVRLEDPAGRAAVVALCEADLEVADHGWTDRIRWVVLGAAPARRVVVELHSLSARGDPGTWLAGQIALFEGGRVELRYAASQRWGGLAVGAGIRGPDGARAGPGRLAAPPGAGYRLTPAAGADLAPVGWSLARRGDRWVGEATVRNQGGAASGPTEVWVQLSADAALARGDRRLGRADLDALAPGAAATVAVDLAVPASAPPGRYRVGVLVDPDDRVAEADETNGRLLDPAPFVVGGLDLAAAGVALDRHAVAAGGRLEVDLTLAARGDAAAPAFGWELRLSADDEVTAADRLLAAGEVPAGLRGDRRRRVRVSVPADAPAGRYRVGVVVDPDDRVAEVAEDGPVLAARPLTVRSGAESDLVAERLELDRAEAAPGERLWATRAFRNAGAVAAGAFDHALVLRPRGGGPPVEARRTRLAGLGPGETVGPRAVPLDLPAGLAPGEYEVLLVVDAAGEVPEADETNGAVAAGRALRVRPAARPELAAAGVEPVFRTARIGGELRLTRRLRNAGRGPSGRFAYGVYLSTNDVISTSDRLLARFELTGLDAGADDRREVAVPVPADVRAGDYWIGVVVDPDGAVRDAGDDDARAAVERVRVDRGSAVVRLEPWRVWVLDGDTVTAAGETYRFLGADTPEKASAHFRGDQEPYASRASAFTRERIRGAREVAIHLSGRDGSFGRGLGHVFVDGVPLSRLLIEAEQAYETVRVFGTGGFWELSRDLQDAARGRQPAFEEPLRWRDRHRVD